MRWRGCGIAGGRQGRVLTPVKSRRVPCSSSVQPDTVPKCCSSGVIFSQFLILTLKYPQIKVVDE
uniref:Uncharacterized protein n=1 Tax=Arundo donax TaxID=35708 RepID=A0A0A9G6W3_ARUDO